MTDKLYTQLFVAFLLFFVHQSFESNSQELESIRNLEGAQRGDVIQGLNQIKKYLKKYGYYSHDIEYMLDDHFDDVLESALKVYQKYLHINVTGRVDSATITAMLTPRCGVPDIVRNPTSKINHLVSNFKFPGKPNKWDFRSYNLSYVIKNDVDVFTEDELAPAYAKAFKSWADVSPFTFTRVKRRGKVEIGFFPKKHGDGFPFGIEFAHTFFPPNGDVHLNANYSWSFNPTEKNEVDVQTVAVHEFGHALGLDHSQFKTAVMYPYIKIGTTHRELTDDDKKGIRALYSS
ncbi:hypothetical protein like AT1G59970 [Hibiscus trionum]|uniref:Peptidase metallopeptidase domain-containing protein n=1 Tax=Hibiscus trionum TaxID=183268 RepID=A0A9W7GXB0_HIBTR|nr:hypothetical protein like AT1G59970 [Hibiscus trionum]